jgi:hypothetical protein
MRQLIFLALCLGCSLSCAHGTRDCGLAGTVDVQLGDGVEQWPALITCDEAVSMASAYFNVGYPWTLKFVPSGIYGFNDRKLTFTEVLSLTYAAQHSSSVVVGGSDVLEHAACNVRALNIRQTDHCTE